MKQTPLFKMHRSPQDFVEVLEWLASNKLEAHLKVHLSELPDHHKWWSDVLEAFGEGFLEELGVL